MKIKGIGIVRRVDDLGRIELNIKVKDPIEISFEDSNIILKKYENRCIFCGKLRPQHIFQKKKICNKCLEEIKNAK